MPSLLAAALGPSGGAAAGLSVSGGFGVALPCASATRSRFLPEVFDDCSALCRRISLRERAIIRDMSETVFAVSFLETGGTVGCELREKKVCFSILSTDMASPALGRLQRLFVSHLVIVLWDR